MEQITGQHNNRGLTRLLQAYVSIYELGMNELRDDLNGSHHYGLIYRLSAVSIILTFILLFTNCIPDEAGSVKRSSKYRQKSSTNN